MSDAREILADPVTKHMRTDPTRIPAGSTVARALDYVRDHEVGGRVVYFYAVDADDRLVGVVPTRRLRARPDTPVAGVMIRPVVSVPAAATVLDACEFFTLHKLLAFPVVDAEHKLVGLVDADLYTDELADLERRREGDDLFQLVGVYLTEADQRRAVLAARKRFPWLLCNVAGGMIAAVIADAHADVAALALVTPFIALVTGVAEGVAMQSVRLALQTMHGRRAAWGRSAAGSGGRPWPGSSSGRRAGWSSGRWRTPGRGAPGPGCACASGSRAGWRRRPWSGSRCRSCSGRAAGTRRWRPGRSPWRPQTWSPWSCTSTSDAGS